MIRSCDIKDPKSTPIKWWPKVEALAKPRTFTFEPGLNILWGKNGSGKTTVIKLLARLLHCEQSGAPVVTEHSVRELFDGFGFGDEKAPGKLKKAITLDHDGQGVRHFDPTVAVGLMGGMSAFDWDFGMEGIQNTMFKGSAGQTTMFRIDKIIGALLKGEPAEIDRRIKAEGVNDSWAKQLKVAEHFLKGSGKKGQPTVLLDEPERSFDLPTQVMIWRFIRAYSKQVQFIVASHSFFALGLPGVNYIELTDGYLEQGLICQHILREWAGEEPSILPPEKKAKAKSA